MKDILNNIKNIKNNNPDLIIKKTNWGFKTIYLIYLETLSSSDKVNEYILKQLNFNNPNDILVGPNTNIISNREIFNYLMNGYTCLIIGKKIIAIETKADLFRSISSPTKEPSLIGPNDSFNENIQNNIGLIKRRIKNKYLKTNSFKLGKITNTNIALLYLSNKTNPEIVNTVNEIISNLDIDSIIDSADLARILKKNNKMPFPTILKTERPDVTAKYLTEGKIVIVIDGSCNALILPVNLNDFINPKMDEYINHHNISFVRILRVFCFLATILAPAFYISLINYNQESIPTSLLINFSAQRNGVPFPAVIEAFIMIILCEILRESDLRFPSNYGSAISILGTLIIGEAAVSAGIVSPIMIIIIAITFITSLIFTEYELICAIRHYRFIFLLCASTLGILGICFSGMCFITKLSSISILSYSYLPVSGEKE